MRGARSSHPSGECLRLPLEWLDRILCLSGWRQRGLPSWGHDGVLMRLLLWVAIPMQSSSCSFSSTWWTWSVPSLLWLWVRHHGLLWTFAGFWPRNSPTPYFCNSTVLSFWRNELSCSGWTVRQGPLQPKGWREAELGILFAPPMPLNLPPLQPGQDCQWFVPVFCASKGPWILFWAWFSSLPTNSMIHPISF